MLLHIYIFCSIRSGSLNDNFVKMESCYYISIFFAVYDPDPLMTTLSRRKRRQSWESGTSDGSRATKTPRASIDEPQPLQPPKTHVHSGDLKMRINVSQSKQKKTNSGSQQNSTSAAKVVRKTALAQRPSISSVSITFDEYLLPFIGLRYPRVNT